MTEAPSCEMLTFWTTEKRDHIFAVAAEQIEAVRATEDGLATLHMASGVIWTTGDDFDDALEEIQKIRDNLFNAGRQNAQIEEDRRQAEAGADEPAALGSTVVTSLDKVQVNLLADGVSNKLGELAATLERDFNGITGGWKIRVERLQGLLSEADLYAKALKQKLGE